MAKKETIGIIGLGKYGLYLAQELAENGKSIICVDKDETKVKKVLSISEGAYISEDLSLSNLEEMGFKDCSIIIVCISSQMDRAILATLTALSLEVNRVIALSNSDEQGIVLTKLGAEVIYPYKDSVNRLVKKIMNNNFLDYVSLNDDVEIIEIKLPHRYQGVSVLDSDIRKKYGLNIIAIGKKGQVLVNIDPHYVFDKEDTLVLIGNKEQMSRFQQIE